ncbi:hypothetical protein LEP1GSC137_2406 [Leptospira borgpetersenii str. Noumea 25]|uniref:Uncharacterized protein n=1 Tax=Leptospira borgpetersenii serovar Ballum TaxID=280505 RepID=A0A0S2IUG7_LEPBO|nr:hypothetical protein LBBP_03065 [Leptospira borgpetersenii serovar Ballum]EKQ99646.1 hypothetical protein LEP1GSC121_2227 [Leptospira borgpetersenii serovar Castellonis str. 200801910]EMO09693.1 hypothetical protein LEP1GSC137_2406 [Leptospira borgpetersenii str. Noumea 25]
MNFFVLNFIFGTTSRLKNSSETLFTKAFQVGLRFYYKVCE